MLEPCFNPCSHMWLLGRKKKKLGLVSSSSFLIKNLLLKPDQVVSVPKPDKKKKNL